jgi:hypothetical protein
MCNACQHRCRRLQSQRGKQLGGLTPPSTEEYTRHSQPSDGRPSLGVSPSPLTMLCVPLTMLFRCVPVTLYHAVCPPYHAIQVCPCYLLPCRVSPLPCYSGVSPLLRCVRSGVPPLPSFALHSLFLGTCNRFLRPPIRTVKIGERCERRNDNL